MTVQRHPSRLSAADRRGARHRRPILQDFASAALLAMFLLESLHVKDLRANCPAYSSQVSRVLP